MTNPDEIKARMKEARAKEKERVAQLKAANKPKSPVVGKTTSLRPDYTKQCEVCGAAPVVPLTGMCGPCTFGDASTINGNW